SFPHSLSLSSFLLLSLSLTLFLSPPLSFLFLFFSSCLGVSHFHFLVNRLSFPQLCQSPSLLPLSSYSFFFLLLHISLPLPPLSLSHSLSCISLSIQLKRASLA